MQFNAENYQAIREACEKREETEFWADKADTLFAGSEAPETWTAYPPCSLPKELYAQVFVYAGTDKRGALTRLELLVHLDGGRVYYQAQGEEAVSLKITWPNAA